MDQKIKKERQKIARESAINRERETEINQDELRESKRERE